jgi:hypothetical protein
LTEKEPKEEYASVVDLEDDEDEEGF